MKAKRLVIRGRVQGVGYRQWMLVQARRLGLTGWVRNRLDGSVEAVIEGPEDALAELQQLAQSGPRAARVESVDAEDSAAQGFAGFEWRPSA